MKTSIKIITGFLCFFMLIPGLVKFTEPFKTFFSTQISKSELPFPLLTFWSGQLGEIILKIDSCNSIQDLAMLHGRGELAAAMGEDFQEFVYDSILAMEKSSK